MTLSTRIDVSAIVLAAGESRRMGDHNKLLLPVSGKAMLLHVIDNVIAGGAGDTIVVLGHDRLAVQVVIDDRPVKIIHNPDYRNGMTTTIRAGVAAAAPSAAGYMICLSDLPFIRPNEYLRLINTFQHKIVEGKPTIIRPVFEGRRGNPVIFSDHFQEEILLQVGFHGCRGIIKDHPEAVVYVEMNTPHVLQDIDSPGNYRQRIRNKE